LVGGPATVDIEGCSNLLCVLGEDAGNNLWFEAMSGPD
jgi:hypothetical protein